MRAARGDGTGLPRGASAPQPPLYLALADAIERHRLPLAPFHDLLSACRQDLEKTRYASFGELMDYCRRSANPVGRLLTRVTSDVAALNELFTSGVVAIFGDIFTLIGIVAVLLWYSWKLALVTFIVLPFARLFSLSVAVTVNMLQKRAVGFIVFGAVALDRRGSIPFRGRISTQEPARMPAVPSAPYG